MSDSAQRTGQLLFRHRDGGVIRETHIGDLTLIDRPGMTWQQHMTDLAAELRRVADTLERPAPETGVNVWINGKRIGDITGATIESADGRDPIRMGSHATVTFDQDAAPVDSHDAAQRRTAPETGVYLTGRALPIE